MLQTQFKNQQIEHKKLSLTRSRIFNFTFIIELQAKMSLSKHKSHNYATVQMVCLLSSVSSKLSAPVRIPPSPIFSLFFLNFFTANRCQKSLFTCFRLYFKETKLEARAKTSVCQTLQQCVYYNKQCILFEQATMLPCIIAILKSDSQWLCYTIKIDCKTLLRMSVNTCEKY